MDYSRFSYGDFVREEAYNASSQICYAFRRGTDERNGIVLSLGNMVSGYPFMLDGVRFHNSECAYIAGAFSDGTEEHLALQERLAVCTNGFMAKKAIRKPNEALKRADWESFNVQWMLYVVWTKCLGNADFRKVLFSLPVDAVIIEDSTFQNGRTATVWGTKNAELKSRLNQLKKELKAKGVTKASIKRELDAKRLGEWANVGVFRGKNVMGKILMACRDALRNGSEPQIDYALLREKRINLLGHLLTFEVVQAA
jgi:predicted NAD-dependent protein-ADP-ribosyltransferase YbiA (DUF1768 family)